VRHVCQNSSALGCFHDGLYLVFPQTVTWILLAVAAVPALIVTVFWSLHVLWARHGVSDLLTFVAAVRSDVMAAAEMHALQVTPASCASHFWHALKQ